MPNKPLQPFTPPTAFLNSLHASGITGSVLIHWALYLVIIFWAFYTLVAVYHWVKYSHGSRAAVPAIVIHLVVSLALLAYAFTSATSV